MIEQHKAAIDFLEPAGRLSGNPALWLELASRPTSGVMVFTAGKGTVSIVGDWGFTPTPDDIKDDDPLFAGGLGLDSIDALEIVVMLETEFGIKVKNESAARDNFHSVASLADFVKHRLADKQQAPV